MRVKDTIRDLSTQSQSREEAELNDVLDMYKLMFFTLLQFVTLLSTEKEETPPRLFTQTQEVIGTAIVPSQFTDEVDLHEINISIFPVITNPETSPW